MKLTNFRFCYTSRRSSKQILQDFDLWIKFIGFVHANSITGRLSLETNICASGLRIIPIGQSSAEASTFNKFMLICRQFQRRQFCTFFWSRPLYVIPLSWSRLRNCRCFTANGWTRCGLNECSPNDQLRW